MRRLAITCAAAVGLVVLFWAGVIAPLGVAQAATVPAPHRISLQVPYARAHATARVGHIAGVVPPLGRHEARRQAAGAACTEPNCGLAYHGGALQSSPRIYLLLWGPGWTTSDPVYGDLYRLYSGLGEASGGWSTIDNQYSAGASTTTFAGAWQNTAAPPSVVTEADLAAQANAFASFEGITGDINAQVVIASQTGTCFSDGFAGSCGSPQTSGGYCAWHGYSGSVAFTNLPYLLDAGRLCGENWVNSSSAGRTDGVSTVAGHEYAETVTDPDPPTGWADNADTISGGEVADKCAWGGESWGTLGSDPYGDITLPTGTFAMQSLWSNTAGRCVLTTSPVLNVTKPAAQRTVRNHTVRLQVHAVTNTGTRITFHAARLPTGLHINTSGLITGRATRLGTWTTRVTASTYAGSKTVTFTWRVVR